MLGYLILLCWSEALLNNVHVLMTSVAENSLIQKYSHFCPFVTLPSQNWFDGPFEIFHCVYILAGSWQKWTWNKDDGVSRVGGEDWVQAPPCHCKSEMLYIFWTDKLYVSPSLPGSYFFTSQQV